MARAAYFKDEEIARAHQLREQAKTTSELRKALSVLLIAEAGLDAGKTSHILGISERTVFRNCGNIRNQDGVNRNTWGGRRHCRMTIEEEREFLHSWEARAIQGGVLSVPPIHAALVERLGRPIPLSTTYRLLARHGWRKVQPDTSIQKVTQQFRKSLKKNFPKLWRPPV